MVEWQEELPVTDAQRRAAGAVVAALRQGAPLSSEFLAPATDRATLAQRIARLRGAHAGCELDQPLFSRGAGEAAFRLRCSESPVDLTLRFEPQSALVLDISHAAPRAFGAVCAE
jgi:hypothetical protein